MDSRIELNRYGRRAVTLLMAGVVVFAFCVALFAAPLSAQASPMDGAAETACTSHVSAPDIGKAPSTQPLAALAPVDLAETLSGPAGTLAELQDVEALSRAPGSRTILRA